MTFILIPHSAIPAYRQAGEIRNSLGSCLRFFGEATFFILLPASAGAWVIPAHFLSITAYGHALSTLGLSACGGSGFCPSAQEKSLPFGQLHLFDFFIPGNLNGKELFDRILLNAV
jgi:hypothetical protein